MLFWLLCAVMTVAVTVVTLRPILARAKPDPWDDDDPDLRVYREQLAEVERDIDRGLLTAEEAEAARIEISRRILSAGAATNQPTRPIAQPALFANMVFYLASAIIVTSSIGLYLWQGSPGYGGQPHAERASRPAKGAPVQELIARVEARLREVPDDGQGWDVLAPVYLKQGRSADAARAYERAIALLGENRARLRGLAEAHLAASDGIVSQPVRAAYTKILAKEPHLIAPRFWLAVGLEQDGKREAAAAAYRAILVSAGQPNGQPLPTPLRRLISERLAAVTAKEPPADTAQPTDGKGPAVPEGMAASMPAKERAAMIERMVSGLATRLDEDGGTPDEWQRLMRAYWVMGRREQAVAALAKARKQFAKDAAITEKLNSFARSLGMNPG